MNPTHLKIICQNRFCSSQTYLLSSCSARVILIASGLWLMQVNSLEAMEPEAPVHYSTVKQEKSAVRSAKFYQDADHPLTQDFWKTKDLSERLKELKPHIDTIKKDVINHKINLTVFIKEHLETYKKILYCSQCATLPVQNLEDIHLDEHIVPFIDRDNPQMPTGWSKANVITFPYKPDTSFVASGTEESAPPNLIAIKKFGDIETGLKELIESIIALEVNSAPQEDNSASQKVNSDLHELKIARIYDAVICPKNSLSIIMEAVGTQDIHTFLSTDSSKGAVNSINAVKACADYLAIFHIKNHRKLTQGLDREKYLEHVAWFYKSLLQNTLQEEHEIFKLLFLVPREKLSDSEIVQSNTVVSLLEGTQQEKFQRLVKISRGLFEENAGEVFRSLLSNTEQQVPYFLTLTHGDAHAHNFFYDDNGNLRQTGKAIPADSFQRVSMIDFATIVKTCGSIGDPAEDIGRFLAALRNWWALHQESDHNNEKIATLQNEFINRYLEKVRDSNIIEKTHQKSFEKIFRENCNFYKLRYYKAIFNVQKNEDLAKDRDIKRKFLESWIQENATLESSPQKSIQQNVYREESKDRRWESICTDQKDVIHWLPDRSEEFIESAAEGAGKSYLTFLWEELHRTGSATLSSKAAIAGMGGVGKTSLALEYAHEALKNGGYKVIYWLQSGTKDSLLKGYRTLLLKMGIPIEGQDDERIIDLVKKSISEKHRCLLIYDNVPDATFLKDIIPQEGAHILITSRWNDGWAYSSLNLDVFRAQDAIKYFFKITGLKSSSDNEQTVGELAKELGYLPLALSHAAHYIKLVGGRHVSRQTFKKYLEDFKQESTTHFEKHRNLFKEPESEITYNNLIERTLRMSRKLLSEQVGQNIVELAEKLMLYSSYLDPDVIAEEIFLECCPDQEKLEKALAQLSSLSLIKRVQNQPLFSIHRLVQLVMINEQESKGKQQVQTVFLPIFSIFNNFFKNNIYLDSQIDKLINTLPHILNVLEHSKRLDISCKEGESLEWVGKILYTTIYNMMNSRPFVENQIEISKNKNLRVLGRLENILNSSIINNDVPKWLLKTVEKGHCIFQNTLGTLYHGDFFVDGDFFVAKDYHKALIWFNKAAEQGYAVAKFYLGWMYEKGKGVVQSDAEAFKWYSQAAIQGNKIAQRRLAYMYQKRKNPSEELKWYKKAAAQGDATAQYDVGWMYANGQGVEQSYSKAFKWYTLAAENGEALAQRSLAWMYQEGLGVAKNDTKARHWYIKAAEQGDAKAQYNLGIIYANGQGVTQSYSEAFKWCLMAAQQGLLDAQYNLGIMYVNGQGVLQSDEEAFKWFWQAAEQGHADAIAVLEAMENDL